MDEIIEKLTEYVLALSEALSNDGNANDRPLLTSHLAASAEMYALLHKYNDISAIGSLIKNQIRSHDWSFIAGKSGENIATKWVVFTEPTGIEQ